MHKLCPRGKPIIKWVGEQSQRQQEIDSQWIIIFTPKNPPQLIFGKTSKGLGYGGMNFQMFITLRKSASCKLVGIASTNDTRNLVSDLTLSGVGAIVCQRYWILRLRIHSQYSPWFPVAIPAWVIFPFPLPKPTLFAHPFGLSYVSIRACCLVGIPTLQVLPTRQLPSRYVRCYTNPSGCWCLHAPKCNQTMAQ